MRRGGNETTLLSLREKERGREGVRELRMTCRGREGGGRRCYHHRRRGSKGVREPMEREGERELGCRWMGCRGREGGRWRRCRHWRRGSKGTRETTEREREGGSQGADGWVEKDDREAKGGDVVTEEEGARELGSRWRERGREEVREPMDGLQRMRERQREMMPSSETKLMREATDAREANEVDGKGKGKGERLDLRWDRERKGGRGKRRGEDMLVADKEARSCHRRGRERGRERERERELMDGCRGGRRG